MKVIVRGSNGCLQDVPYNMSRIAKWPSVIIVCGEDLTWGDSAFGCSEGRRDRCASTAAETHHKRSRVQHETIGPNISAASNRRPLVGGHLRQLRFLFSLASVWGAWCFVQERTTACLIYSWRSPLSVCSGCPWCL